MGEDEILSVGEILGKILIRSICTEPDGSILEMNEIGTVSEVELYDEQSIERPDLKPKKKSQNSTKHWKREKKYF